MSSQLLLLCLCKFHRRNGRYYYQFTKQPLNLRMFVLKDGNKPECYKIAISGGPLKYPCKTWSKEQFQQASLTFYWLVIDSRDYCYSKRVLVLTSLALRASETIDTGTSVGSNAAPTILAAVLTHSYRKQKKTDQLKEESHKVMLFFHSLHEILIKLQMISLNHRTKQWKTWFLFFVMVMGLNDISSQAGRFYVRLPPT